MAVMYPRQLLDTDVKSPAEKRVFRRLRDGLDDRWEVFHSASLVFRDHAEGAIDDECDFVLCQPDEAIVCLEVKGGGIECRFGEWYRVDREGRRERMPDPFAQALDHRYNLERKIDSVHSRPSEKLLIVHAVALPDITVHSLALAPDAPREILLDRDDVKEFAPAIERVLAYHRGSREKRQPPGDDCATMLRELLSPQIEIQVPMAAEFLEEQEAFVTLTYEQSAVLRQMKRARRLVVTGCAGSGKTMLAVEHAKRLASDGKEVMLVCFNRALRDHLRQTEGGSRVDFFTFHGLCTHLAYRAGVGLPGYGNEDPPQEYWNEVLPDALVEAVDKLDDRYDAIMVDEAQDLHGHWLTALMSTLRDEEEGIVWLFMDDNQRVYDAVLDVPTEFQPFDLSVNCRNTQAIHREVLKLYEGDVEPTVKGPPGRDVEMFHSADQAATVTNVVHRLCEQEEVVPQDIVVLSAHGWDNSDVARAAGNGFRLVRERGKLGNSVFFSSIRGFKGLESPVVVLCELEDLDPKSHAQQLYVGLSRARNHCVIVAPPAA